MYFSYRVEAVAKTADAATLLDFKNQAWRQIFWVSLPPGVLFVLGSLFVTESPRWLFRRGKKTLAHAALLRSRTPEQAGFELAEMEETARSGGRESLWRRARLAAAAEICDSVSAGVHHSVLQHGYRREFDYWIQRRHPAAERPLRS